MLGDESAQRAATGPRLDQEIRLLFLTSDGFPTFRADVAALFGKYLPRFGVMADLVTHANRPEWREDARSWQAGEIALSEWRPSRLLSTLLALVHSSIRILSARSDRYSAIQVRDRVTAAMLGILKSRMERIPFFYWMSFPHHEMRIRLAHKHGLALGVPRYLQFTLRGNMGRWLLYRAILPAADHIFVQSSKMQEDLAARGIPRERMTSVPMCIDPERFDDSGLGRFADPALANRRIVAYLGSCSGIRRIDFLVDVARDLREDFPDILLLLVGEADEPLETELLRRYISENGMDSHVLMTGWLDPALAQQYMLHAEVALAPMPPDPLLDSTTPTKLVEYLAMGKPVVANDHPDQTAVIRESGAGLCVPFDRRKVADAVRSIMNDPTMAAQFAEAGRAYAYSRRNYRSMAETLAGVYKRLLN